MTARRNSDSRKIAHADSLVVAKGGDPSKKSNLTRLVLAALFVSSATIIVHWPVLSTNSLGIDDDQYLVENRFVQNPSFAHAWKFLSEVRAPSTVQGYYQPLTMVSLMLDSAMGGSTKTLRPFHRTSLTLHTLNVALVVILLYLLFQNSLAAAICGLLFGLHPMTVETMPWIGERKTLLAAIFALISLVAYVRYAQSNGRIADSSHPSPISRGRARWGLFEGDLRWLAASIIGFALALLSKPTSTPLPLVMVLIDLWPLQRMSRKTLLEKLPLFALAGISAILTLVSQAGSLAGVTAPSEQNPVRIVLILCHNIVFYLYKMIWLGDYWPHYLFPEPLTLSNPPILIGLIGTILLLAALSWSLRWTRVCAIGWLIFLVAILPTMGIIGFTLVIASDKFAYLPCIGLLMVLAWFLSKMTLYGTNQRAKRIIFIGTALAVVFFMAAEIRSTRTAISHWRDSETLYRFILIKTPNAPVAHLSLAAILAQSQRLDEAVQHYHSAIQIRPIYVEAHHQLGKALFTAGRFADAISPLKKALELKHDYVPALGDLGIALGGLGKTEEAVETLKHALNFAPKDSNLHNNLGLMLSQSGNPDEAVKHYERAIQLDPRNVRAMTNLGRALMKQGQPDKAFTQFQSAVRVDPAHGPAWYELSLIYRSRNDLPKTIDALKRTLAANPNHPRARQDLAVLSALSNKPPGP
ncbi:MAG: tetratricopeptide repeat protein [Planctomycetota bacterium]